MCSLDYAGYSTVSPGFPLPPEQLPPTKRCRGTADEGTTASIRGPETTHAVIRSPERAARSFGDGRGTLPMTRGHHRWQGSLSLATGGTRHQPASARTDRATNPAHW